MRRRIVVTDRCSVDQQPDVWIRPDEVQRVFAICKRISAKRPSSKYGRGEWARGSFAEPWHATSIGMIGKLALVTLMQDIIDAANSASMTQREMFPGLDDAVHERRPGHTDFEYTFKDYPKLFRHQMKATTTEHNRIRVDHLERNDCMWFAGLNGFVFDPRVGVMVTIRGWMPANHAAFESAGAKKCKRYGKPVWTIPTGELNPTAAILGGWVKSHAILIKK